MSYEAWRITFQDSEQAAKAAYQALQQAQEERAAMAAHVERIISEWNAGEDIFSDEWINRMGDIVEDAPTTSLAQRDAEKQAEAVNEFAKEAWEEIFKHYRNIKVYPLTMAKQWCERRQLGGGQ